MKFILILIVILLIAAVLLKKKFSGEKPGSRNITAAKKVNAPSKTTPTEKDHYRYTSIKCGQGACAVAQAKAGTRFLAEQVPRLPLYGCDASRCNCIYEHHDDRREKNAERRNLSGLSAELYEGSGKPERRDKNRVRGRRAEDRQA